MTTITVHESRPRVGDLSFQQRAVCFQETSAAPELWTPDLQPRGVIRDELAAMCRRCPVSRRCAAYALRTDAEAGFYAGVWIPERRFKGARKRALQELWEIAGCDYGLDAAGVPA